MRLSDELLNLQSNLNFSISHLVTQARVMEEAIDSWPTERSTDPETSKYDGTLASLRLNQQAVIVLFRRYGMMDDKTMIELYEENNKANPLVFPKQAPSGLRTRRSGLVKLGILEVVDNHGTSPTGRRANRYRLT